MAEGCLVVIGGGLAGAEAAWQAAQQGASVRLFEMRPAVRTPAHQTDFLRARL
jgi:methylenetetrahydrofolate--tRNA-(uracil-5-)-methyltransferase